MKILNLKRRIAVLLASIGLIPAGWIWSAELQTNLIVDPSFEVVDEDYDLGAYGEKPLLDWEDADGDDDDNFAYAYSLNYSGQPNPPGAGDYHFWGGYYTEFDVPTLTQLISVNSGPSGSLIASGAARYDLRAFFGSYLEQNEANRVRVRFLAGNTVVATDEIGGQAFLQGLPVLNEQVFWGQDATWGTIPATTTAVEVEIVPDGEAAYLDGYLDLLDFRIGGMPPDVALQLEVNTNTGMAKIQNLTDTAVDLNYYEILSPGGALDRDGWQSLQDQDLEGSGGTSGTGDGWEKAGGISDKILAESFLEGQSRLDLGDDWQLGRLFQPGSAQDLVFRYGLSNGLLLYGVVSTVDTGMVGDYNGNRSLDSGDLDLQAVEITKATNNLAFDLNDDKLVNYDDRLVWVHDLKNVYIGDANLDGEFNTGDLVLVLGAGKYETQQLALWEDGDWNGDQRFGTGDLVASLSDGGYEMGPRSQDAVSAVPEPTAIGLGLAAVGPIALGWGTRRRRTAGKRASR